MTAKEIVQQTEIKMKKTMESVTREFSEVRTGRAHPGLIEGLHIDYYGTLTPLNQVATLSTPDARTITVAPFEKKLIQGQIPVEYYQHYQTLTILLQYQGRSQ